VVPAPFAPCRHDTPVISPECRGDTAGRMRRDERAECPANAGERARMTATANPYILKMA